jgi:NhaP-type Na+/H+ or K+/H+ antiporter
MTAKPVHIPPQPHPWHVAGHMARRALTLLPLSVGTLGLGMAIYHWVEGLPWSDSFLNAAMLLGGMGPVDRLETEAGKWLAGAYALFAGVVFLVLAGIMLGPVIHAVLHRFHLESAANEPSER